MSKIQILTQDVINKIAAGEVVEKPASVVKELIDNSIDAKATNITIEIQDGGLQKILVVDNGLGMSPQDANLSFTRHATSKISTDQDLLNLKTYGFRGEALASISAISKVTLKTKPGGEQLGTEIIIHGGQTISTNQVGCPSGTSILIEELFYNVPARKEFVKTQANEYKHILDVVSKYAIANPLIGFTLVNNGKTIYNFPKEHQLEDRIREIMGADNFNFMVPIFYEHPHVEIFGFLGKPEISSDRKKNQYIFVNKRPIENKNVAFAVKQSFGSLIPKNNYPQFIILIDVATNIVDVNVHPRKEEVKFSNDKFIFDSVLDACKKALERNNLTPGASNTMQNQGAMPGTMPGSTPFGGAFNTTPKPGFGNNMGGFNNPFGVASNNQPNPFGGITRPQPTAGFGNNFAKPFGTSPKPFQQPLQPANSTNLTQNQATQNANVTDNNKDKATNTQNQKTNVTTQISQPTKPQNDKTPTDNLTANSKTLGTDVINDKPINPQDTNNAGVLSNAKNSTNINGNQMTDNNPAFNNNLGFGANRNPGTNTNFRPNTGFGTNTGLGINPGFRSNTGFGSNAGLGTNTGYGANPGFGNSPTNPWNTNFNKDPFYDDLGDNFDNFGIQQPGNMFDNQASAKILQLHNLYIVTESPDGIIIYDQHALHERILFDKFSAIRRLAKDERNSQQLTAPITLQPSVKECEILNQNLSFFESIGFAIEDFGANMFKISSVPEFMVNQDVKKIILDMISDLDSEVGEVREDFDNKALAYLSCKSAYKAGDFIPPGEIQSMLSALAQTDVQYTCPHGRPLKIEFTKDELEKLFLRK